MPKRASDFAKEVCYISPSGRRLHKNPDCKFLKNREVIKTNRRDTYIKGIEIICVTCWWDNVPEEEEVKKSMVVSFVARPVKVSGIQWTGENLEEIKRFCNNMAFIENGNLFIETREGTSRARVGDWIIQGTMGEFYPVKPDVMAAKYDRIDE